MAEGRKLRRGEPLGMLGSPGLWKQIRENGGARPVFELPATLLGLDGGCDDEEEEGLDLLVSFMAWAMDTARGKAPRGWEAPQEAEVGSWLGPQDLTIRTGGHIRNGRVIRTDHRLAVSFPIVNRVPPDLSPARRAWLDEVLLDAQDCRRMVRLGRRADGDRVTVEAEIDLTGAPLAIVSDLFGAGLDSLRGAVSWLLSPAALVVDATTCRMIDVVEPRRPAARS